ncbi:TPA: ABC transporter permease, partial [Streptococcus pyogenes]
MKRTTIIIIWKIIRCVTLIFGVSVLTFVLLKQSPVDPV